LRAVHRQHHGQKRPPSQPSFDNGQSRLFASKHDPPSDEVAADGDDAVVPSSRRGSRFLRNVIRRRSKPVALALLGVGALLPGSSSLRNLLVPPAHASAPMVLRESMKKEEPPIVQAEKKADELRRKKSMEEFDAFMVEANNIEVERGKAARDEYETQYQLDKAAKAAQLKVDVELLKRKLFDAGKDPHTDVDAQREVFLLEKGIDLEKVRGTDQNIRMVENFRKRGKGMKTFDDQRYIVSCQVADLKARGIDPMEFFGDPEGMDKTHAIYRMDDRNAAKVAEQFRGIMEKYGGRLSPAQEGEVPFVYADTESAATAGGESTASAKEEKAIARAKANSIRTAQKEAAREARAKAKAERKDAKVQAKADKAAAKDARVAEKAAGAAAALAAKEAAAAAASVAATAASAIADGDVAADVAAIGNDAVAESPAVEKVVTTQQTATGAPSKAKNAISELKQHATPKNAAAVLVVGGAATYGFNYYKENNGAAQSERERQLKLILGGDDEDEDDDEDEFDDDEDDEYEQFIQKKPNPPKPKPTSGDDMPKSPSKPAAPPSPPPAVPAPKPKRKLGIFAKRNANMRETDLNALVGAKAQAPEFARLLSQILTFGAPGRFPAVSSWGDMPLGEFDLDAAKSLLTNCREEADLADEQSAEIFASVVNCMIIDIVDLASSTLKGKNKEEKVTVDAINVVMDFMDHAASLFDAVAKDVTIKPVTYGGKLRKKDLEEMFSIYAGSSMMTGTTQDRVDTLQLVFAIADKKAEGLMQKHMMKMMMNLMKDGGKGLEGMEGMPGMEGMEDMMNMMGGAGGMGMPGMDGGEISPEDLKQTLGMMKELMDSGQVSDEELVEVRKQFKEMYGSDISDLIKKADEEGAGEGMTGDERELLDMFKRILGEE